MKSVIGSKSVVSRPFPKLMRNRETGSVVLFNSERGGTVVYVCEFRTKGGRLGDYSPVWYLDYFEDFSDSVTLSNS